MDSFIWGSCCSLVSSLHLPAVMASHILLTLCGPTTSLESVESSFKVRILHSLGSDEWNHAYFISRVLI